jgi:hypothetical protein
VAGEVKNMTAPPVDPATDLTALPWFPILRVRLFRSEFHLKATDGEWRAAVTLWIRSWEQQPTGSLPDDDKQLQRLAGLARQWRKWHNVRAMALHGWFLCDDGRLYHNTIAELVNDTIQRTTRGGAKSLQGRGKVAAKSLHTRGRTGQEPPLESMADFDELKGRESPPKSPPRNGGDQGFAFEGEKGSPVVEVWPRWLEDMWGPLPDGPIKRQQALAASRQEPTPEPTLELKRACNRE